MFCVFVLCFKMEEVPLKDHRLVLFIQQSYINFLSWSVFCLALVHQAPYGSKRILPLFGEETLESSDSNSLDLLVSLNCRENYGSVSNFYPPHFLICTLILNADWLFFFLYQYKCKQEKDKSYSCVPTHTFMCLLHLSLPMIITFYSCICIFWHDFVSLFCMCHFCF